MRFYLVHIVDAPVGDVVLCFSYAVRSAGRPLIHLHGLFSSGLTLVLGFGSHFLFSKHIVPSLRAWTGVFMDRNVLFGELGKKRLSMEGFEDLLHGGWWFRARKKHHT